MQFVRDGTGICEPDSAHQCGHCWPMVICLDQNATFSATPTNGGTTPTYQWFVNDNPVGNGPIYSTPALANGDQVYCTMTSNATCPSQATTTSPTTIVTVLALPNAQIVPGSTTTFCQGDSVALSRQAQRVLLIHGTPAERQRKVSRFQLLEIIRSPLQQPTVVRLFRLSQP